MKKFLTLMVSVIIISTVLLSACSSPAKDNGAESENSEDVTANSGGVVNLVADGANLKEENIEDFAEFISSADKPVFVDFWAEWCGPCKESAPIVKKMATEFDGKAYIVQIDVDTDMGDKLASEYGVQGIPMFTVIKDGDVVESVTGYGPDSPKKLNDLLSSAID